MKLLSIHDVRILDASMDGFIAAMVCRSNLMGLKIATIDPKKKTYPIGTYLELMCDEDHGFLDAPSQKFIEDGFIEQFSAAMNAGWKEKIHPSRGRIFLCPGCSGK